MKKPIVITFLLAILSLCGPAAPTPPLVSGRVELVLDVYSARRDLHRNVEDDQAFWLWLRDLRKGNIRPLRSPGLPEVISRADAGGNAAADQ